MGTVFWSPRRSETWRENPHGTRQRPVKVGRPGYLNRLRSNPKSVGMTPVTLICHLTPCDGPKIVLRPWGPLVTVYWSPTDVYRFSVGVGRPEMKDYLHCQGLNTLQGPDPHLLKITISFVVASREEEVIPTIVDPILKPNQNQNCRLEKMITFLRQ